jgi:hypothetical protein
MACGEVSLRCDNLHGENKPAVAINYRS